MKNNYRHILSSIIPNKKSNLFFIIIIIIGITIGSIYAISISQNDKALVSSSINQVINAINNNTIKNSQVFKNCILSNNTYICLIGILGLTLIGSFISLIAMLFKSFTVGFTIASFIITYKIKGLILSLIYLVFSELITISIILLLTIYSFIFTTNFIKTICLKNPNKIAFKTHLKRYLIIFIFGIITTLITALSESYLIPAILKLIVRIYV